MKRIGTTAEGGALIEISGHEVARIQEALALLDGVVAETSAPASEPPVQVEPPRVEDVRAQGLKTPLPKQMPAKSDKGLALQQCGYCDHLLPRTAFKLKRDGSLSKCCIECLERVAATKRDKKAAKPATARTGLVKEAPGAALRRVLHSDTVNAMARLARARKAATAGADSKPKPASIGAQVNPRNKTCPRCERKFYDATPGVSQQFCGGSACNRDNRERPVEGADRPVLAGRVQRVGMGD